MLFAHFDDASMSLRLAADAADTLILLSTPPLFARPSPEALRDDISLMLLIFIYFFSCPDTPLAMPSHQPDYAFIDFSARQRLSPLPSIAVADDDDFLLYAPLMMIFLRH